MKPYRLDALSFGYPGGPPLLEEATFIFPDTFGTLVTGWQGCGISSLFRLFIGLLRPATGRVWVGDDDLFALPTADFNAYRLRVGNVFEQDGLLSNMSLLENLVLPLVYHGLLPEAQAKRRAHELLMNFDLDELADIKPAYVSKSARKVCALARALVLHPRVLILDHPTEGLHDVETDVFCALLERHRAKLGLKQIFVRSEDEEFISRFKFSSVAFKHRKLIHSQDFPESARERETA